MSGFRHSILPPSTARKTRPQEPFPVLDFAQIAASLNEVAEYGLNEELLMRPTQQFVCKLYGDIIDWFLGVSQHHLRTGLEKAGQEVENPEAQGDARLLMGLHRHVYKFMVDCGVEDFNIMDLVKPEPNRLRRMLSAVVAFAVFREERMKELADNVEESRRLAREFESLESQHEALGLEIQNREQQNQENKDNCRETVAHNQQVESELRKLKREQEALTSQHDAYKQEKSSLLKQLEEHNFLIVEATKNSEQMRTYIVESPERLHKINTEMARSLELKQVAVDTQEKRLRALEVTATSLVSVDADIQGCITAMEEYETELLREQHVLRKKESLQDTQERLKMEERDLDVRIQQLTRQLSSANDRARRARAQGEQKKAAAQEKMNQLYAQRGTLQAERSLMEKEINDKARYIEEIQDRISSVVDEWHTELKATTDKCEQLESHVTLYLESMEERL